VEIFSDCAKIFGHEFNPAGQKILLVYDKRGGFGDTLANLPYAAAFAKNFSCRVKIFLPEYLRDFAANLYPATEQTDSVTLDSYATFFLSMYGGIFPFCSVDFRHEQLERMAGKVLGMEILPPKATFAPTEPRICSEPYVCIGVQASKPTKGWLWPRGWEIVVGYLKSLGYRVFCIDRENFQCVDNYAAKIPPNAEDFTGDFPIMHRANMLHRAEFFVGLSSGLAWLANAVNCPVVMICGFSRDWFEFYTPYRVSNRLTCNGCLNDVRVNFLQDVCPRHKGTPRELECQKKISPRQVIDAIERLILDRNLTPPILR